MSIPVATRRRKTTLGRYVLSAFVLVWLNMALQPCVMAMGSEPEPDCAHCPPAHSQEAPPCDVEVAPGCDYDSELNFDARTIRLEPNDAPTELPAAITSTALEWPEASGIACPRPRPPTLADPSGPPLNIRFCVYLK